MHNYKRISEKEFQKIDKRARGEHPNTAFLRIRRLVNKIGAKKFLSASGYNKERDCLIACFFAYAIREHTGQEWFLVQIDDPPDFEMFGCSDRKMKDKPIDHAKIEIIEIPKSIDKQADKLGFATGLLSRKKLKNYFPEKGTMLLIFINAYCSSNLSKELKHWYDDNKKLFNKFGEVFVIYINAVPNNSSFEYTVISLSNNWMLIMDLKKEFSKKPIEHPLMKKIGLKVMYKKDNP